MPPEIPIEREGNAREWLERAVKALSDCRTFQWLPALADVFGADAAVHRADARESSVAKLQKMIKAAEQEGKMGAEGPDVPTLAMTAKLQADIARATVENQQAMDEARKMNEELRVLQQVHGRETVASSVEYADGRINITFRIPITTDALKRLADTQGVAVRDSMILVRGNTVSIPASPALWDPDIRKAFLIFPTLETDMVPPSIDVAQDRPRPEPDPAAVARQRAQEKRNRDIAEAKKNEEAVRQDVEREYGDLHGRIEERRKAFDFNARSTDRQIRELGFVARQVARANGVLRGMELSRDQDRAAANRCDQLLKELRDSAENASLPARQSVMARIWTSLGITRPDYRDANAMLARGSDRLQRYDVLTPLRERPPFTVGQEMYVLASPTVFQRGWIIQSSNDDQIVLTKNGETVTRTPNQVWHVAAEIESGRAMNPNVPGGELPQMFNRMYTMLERYGRMSAEEYHQYFDGPLQQMTIGNCYLIAAFESLRHSPFAEIILRSSVRVETGPNGKTYLVRVPLGDADGRIVTVRSQDLLPSRRQNSRLMRPVMAAPGWIALETAYTAVAHGGNREASEGGRGHRAMGVMFGRGVGAELILSRDENRPLSSDPPSRQAAENWLNAFARNPSRNIATAGTPYGDEDKFSVGGTDFYHGHAYALLKVDAQSKTVVVSNPYDTSTSITLTYDQFMDTFRGISSAAINPRRMFAT